MDRLLHKPPTLGAMITVEKGRKRVLISNPEKPQKPPVFNLGQAEIMVSPDKQHDYPKIIIKSELDNYYCPPTSSAPGQIRRSCEMATSLQSPRVFLSSKPIQEPRFQLSRSTLDKALTTSKYWTFFHKLNNLNGVEGHIVTFKTVLALSKGYLTY